MTGDSLVTNRIYDPETGRLLEILTLNGNDTVQKNSYEYDKIANLAARTDHVHGMREDFIYDKLNRLTGIVEDNDTTARFNYDAYGRMLRKYMHSALVFDSASYNAGNRPHAIAQAQTPLDMPLHSMRYTHFDKLAYLEQDTLALSYIYGYEHQRLHSTEADIHGDTLRQKEYVGNCEYIDNGMYTTALTYLSGPLGVFGVQEKRDGYRPDRYFIHPDHLGSWTLITDSYANVIQDVAYDAWGTPYCFNATGTEPATSLLFDRGFTGHEHLLYFGLINMNGRMYDPFTSSFLSVDNYVQSPDYTQSFNRYAYCLNNPLKYTDPDGEFWHIVIGAAIGGVANLATNWGKIDTFGEGLAYFGIGAAAGALSTVTGGAAAGVIKLGGFVSGTVTGAVSGATSSFITGAGNSWMQGSNFGEGLLSGIIQGGISAGIGVLTGGIMEGWMDYCDGYSFWDGTMQVGEKTTFSAIENTPDLMPYDPKTLGDLDCAPATLSWTDRSLGGDMSVWQAKGIVKRGPNGGCYGEASVQNYCKETGRSFGKRTPNLTKRQRCAEVYSEIKKGNRVILDVHDSDASMNHFVGVKSVTKTPLISSKGFDVSRYSFSIMDPSYSSYINQNSRYVRNAFRAFYIRP